jgi:hypothetical protein
VLDRDLVHWCAPRILPSGLWVASSTLQHCKLIKSHSSHLKDLKFQPPIFPQQKTTPLTSISWTSPHRSLTEIPRTGYYPLTEFVSWSSFSTFLQLDLTKNLYKREWGNSCPQQTWEYNQFPKPHTCDCNRTWAWRQKRYACGAPRRASEDAYVADDVFRDVRPYPKRKYGSGALEGGSGHQTKREGTSGYQSEGKGYWERILPHLLIAISSSPPKKSMKIW